jgi:hypothetical protein
MITNKSALPPTTEKIGAAIVAVLANGELNATTAKNKPRAAKRYSLFVLLPSPTPLLINRNVNRIINRKIPAVMLWLGTEVQMKSNIINDNTSARSDTLVSCSLVFHCRIIGSNAMLFTPVYSLLTFSVLP